jgi:hypothetical protein
MREQRAENREQRAEGREQRTESREQRAESREQRAESREQRANVVEGTLQVQCNANTPGTCGSPVGVKYIPVEVW